jgi:hypothetical protein
MRDPSVRSLDLRFAAIVLGLPIVVERIDLIDAGKSLRFVHEVQESKGFQL